MNTYTHQQCFGQKTSSTLKLGLCDNDIIIIVPTHIIDGHACLKVLCDNGIQRLLTVLMAMHVSKYYVIMAFNAY